MSEKNVLMINRQAIELSVNAYSVKVGEGSMEYTSPNGFIKRKLSLKGLEKWQSASFSFPTSDLSQYQNIADDLINYKSFMDSFDLQTVEEYVRNTMKN